MATKYFNYETVARAGKIPPDKMEKLLDLGRGPVPGRCLTCLNCLT